MTQALPHIANVVVFEASTGDNWSQTSQNSGHHDGGTTATTTTNALSESNNLHHHHHQQHQTHHHHQQQQQSQVLSPSTSKSITTPSVPPGGDTIVFTSPSTITDTTNSSTSNSRGTSGGIYTYTSTSTISSIPLSSSSSFFATPNSGACSTIESPTFTTGSVISTGTLPQTASDALTAQTGHRLLLLLQQQQQQQQQLTTTTIASSTTTNNTPSTTSLLLSSSSPTTSRKNKDNTNIVSNNTLTLSANPKLSSGLVLALSGSPGGKSDNVVTTTLTTSATTTTPTTTILTTNNNNLLKSSPGLGLSSSSSSSSPSCSSFSSTHSSSCSFTSSSSLRITKSPSTIITCPPTAGPTGTTHLPSSPRTDTRKFRGLAGSRGPCSSYSLSGGETTTTTSLTSHPIPGEEETYPRISATPEDGKERLASIEDNIESSISAKARAKISNILQEVNQLSDVEKLLLYLKLPTGATSDDPLTLSPTSSLHASSRVEQTQAYTWIKSHLEEDSDICLPKQEVYEEYRNYCESLNLRRLSTADFGKIMKCVFPNIKPRRLGQRGQSKYVYSGIRRKLEVQPPVLPELEISPRKISEDDCYGRDELFSASCQLVCEWAEKLLERAFSGLRELSEFLVSNSYVNSKSMAAFTVSAAMQEAGILNSSAAMSSLFSNASGGDKHRETQLQLQRKLQEREMLKEQKRRLHQQKQENEHETKSPHRTRNESHTPGLPSPKTKFLSPSSCLRFRSSSSLENLLMPTAVSDNKSHIKEQVPVPTSGRERVMSAGNKPPAISQDAATSAAQVKIHSARSLFQDKSSDRQCVPSEGSETKVTNFAGTKVASPGLTDLKHSKTPELETFHSLKKPSVIPVQSWADEKNSSAQQTSTAPPGPSNLSAILSTSAQTSTESLHKPQLLTTDVNQNISSDANQSEKAVSSSASKAFMLNMVLEKTSRVGTGVPLVSQTGSAKSAFVPFSQMHLQNIAETKTTQSTDYLPTSTQKSSDSSEPSILAQMLECNDNSSTLASPSSSGNYIQVPTLKSGWESEGGTPVSSTECVRQTSPSVTKRSRSRFAPIRPKAMQAKTILSLLQEQSGSNLDSTPYDRRRVATILKEKHAREQTETVSTSSTSLPVTATATATIATSAFGSIPTATEMVAFPMNPVVSKPNELFIILGSPATGTVSAAGNVFLSPSQNSSTLPTGTTLDPQQVTAAGTTIFQAIPSMNSSAASQTEMLLSTAGNANSMNPQATGETLAWKTIQLDPTTLPHIAIPSQQLFTSLNPQQEAGTTSSLGIAVPLSGGLLSTNDPQECMVDPAQFMISKNFQLDGALLSGFNFNPSDPSQSAQSISVSNLLPVDLATPQVTVKMETAETDNPLLMTTGQVPKKLSEEPILSIMQPQQSTEIADSRTSISKFIFTNFGASRSGVCNEGTRLSVDGDDNGQSEVKEEKSDPPTKPASLLRPLLNSDLLPGEFTKTKILNELLSTEDSLPETSPRNESDSSGKPKLETMCKSNINNPRINEPKTQNTEKNNVPVQMQIPTGSASLSTSTVARTGKLSRRARAKSIQGSTTSSSRLHLRTLSADANPAAAATSPGNSNSVGGINIPSMCHTNTIAAVIAQQGSNFASKQLNVTLSPSISSTSDLNASLLTDTVVTYSNQVLSSHATSDSSEPSSSEDKNQETIPSFPISEKDRANQLLRDLGIPTKLQLSKSPTEIHPTSRKRKSSEKSSGSNIKRKQQSNKTSVDFVGQLDSSITSPLVSCGQEWTTVVTNIPENPETVSSCLTAEPLQSPDISSVEKDALLDPVPQMLSLELSNAGSMHYMPSSKMSSHSQTMPSGSDTKTLLLSNLSSSQQFDRQISDLLNLAQPLSIEGMSPASSVSDSSSLPHPQLSLQGVPYSQLSPQQVNIATELAVFKRSVTDPVATFLQPTEKIGQSPQAVVNMTPQKTQFSQETPSLLQKHLTNMVVDDPLSNPHEEGQQQQCMKSSFLCEMLQSSDLGDKDEDFFEEELPSDVADFITESMTTNQSESVFPSGSANSNSSTGNLQPFPDLKLDVEDLLNQATPPSTTDAAAVAAVRRVDRAAADLGANVFAREDTLKHATTSVSILGKAETSKTLNSTQNRPFRDHLETSNTFAIPDAQAVVRKGVEVKQGRFSAATSHQPHQQASSVQNTSTSESAIFRMTGQEFVAPNVTIPQRWHTLSYEKTGSHTPVSDSGYSSASPIRSTPPTVPFTFGTSAENLVNNVISQLEHRSASCEPPSQSPLTEPIQAYTPVATLPASNISAGPSPTSLPPSPQTFTPIHGSSIGGTTYDPPPIRPTATVANKTLPTPQLNALAVTSSQQPSKINKENNRELLNLLQSKSPPSYENAIRMLNQKLPHVASSSQLIQRSPSSVSSGTSDVQPQPQQIVASAAKPRTKARSRSTSNTATKGRRKRLIKESGCTETREAQIPQLVRCLSDNSALPSSSVAAATETSQPEPAQKSDTDKPSIAAAADGPPSKTKKSVQISPAYPFSYKLSLLKDRSVVGGQVITTGDHPVISVEHPPTASQASYKLTKSGKVNQEEGLGSGTSVGGGSSNIGSSGTQSVTTSRSQSVPLQNVTTGSTQPKHGGRQQKKSAHISDLPNVNYMGNAPNVDLGRVFWEKLLTTPKSQGVTQGVTVMNISSKGGSNEGTSTVNVVTAPSKPSTKRNLIQLLEDRTSSAEEVEQFKSNLDDLLGMHCMSPGGFPTSVSGETLNQSLLVTSVQQQPQIVASSNSSAETSSVSATSITTTTPTTTVPSLTVITANSNSSHSSVLEEEITAGAYQGQELLNHSMSFSPPPSMQ